MIGRAGVTPVAVGARVATPHGEGTVTYDFTDQPGGGWVVVVDTPVRREPRTYWELEVLA